MIVVLSFLAVAILANSQEFRNRFRLVQEAFSQQFKKVQFDLSPDIIEGIHTHTDEDILDLVIDVAIDSNICLLKLSFEGDGGYCLPAPGERTLSTHLAFVCAEIDAGSDVLLTDQDDPSTVHWFGGGEYYDDDGNLIEKPDFYTRLELVLPAINQAFASYTLHPELAMDKQTSRSVSERAARFFGI